ncbi:MAG: hypothetical protein V4621_07500 [Pseudomonadota bacterium]
MNLHEIELVAVVQPEIVDFQLADGIFIKSALFKKSGTVVPQHSHEYDHSSFIATGSARVWCDGEDMGEFVGPKSVFIKKRAKHTFMTTSPDTLILCIHNIERTGDIDIHDLHELHFP